MSKEKKYLSNFFKGRELDLAIKRMNNGEPVQYIVGHVDFYGHLIKVNPSVLIPRFETEELVYKTVNYIKKQFNENVKIADICTGSGCIAISLKYELPKSFITATDISKEALETALDNAYNVHLFNKNDIEFLQGDMLEALKNNDYDVIISNPPYISYDEEVMDIVKNNEPHIALYADNDGLYYYEKLFLNATKYLNKKSLIALEIGYKQGEKIKALAKTYFPNSIVKIEKDMQNRDRFLFVFSEV